MDYWAYNRLTSRRSDDKPAAETLGMSEKTEPRCSTLETSKSKVTSLNDELSGDAVAAKILDEVLDNVLDKTQWDIASLGRSLATNRKTPGAKKQKQNPFLGMPIHNNYLYEISRWYSGGGLRYRCHGDKPRP